MTKSEQLKSKITQLEEELEIAEAALTIAGNEDYIDAYEEEYFQQVLRDYFNEDQAEIVKKAMEMFAPESYHGMESRVEMIQEDLSGLKNQLIFK